MSTELPSQQALMIGRRVRTARERREWTMTELAKRAGVNREAISWIVASLQAARRVFG